MRRMISAAAIVAAGFLTGAAQQASDKPAPIANLTFSKGYNKGMGIGASTLQSYFLLRTGTCKKKKRLAGFTWATGSSVTKPIGADTPITLHAIVNRATAYRGGTCENSVTFTPLAGHSYGVVQETKVWDYCMIRVVDTATGEPPADLTFSNANKCA